MKRRGFFENISRAAVLAAGLAGGVEAYAAPAESFDAVTKFEKKESPPAQAATLEGYVDNCLRDGFILLNDRLKNENGITSDEVLLKLDEIEASAKRVVESTMSQAAAQEKIAEVGKVFAELRGKIRNRTEKNIIAFDLNYYAADFTGRALKNYTAGAIELIRDPQKSKQETQLSTLEGYVNNLIQTELLNLRDQLDNLLIPNLLLRFPVLELTLEQVAKSTMGEENAQKKIDEIKKTFGELRELLNKESDKKVIERFLMNKRLIFLKDALRHYMNGATELVASNKKPHKK